MNCKCFLFTLFYLTNPHTSNVVSLYIKYIKFTLRMSLHNQVLKPPTGTADACNSPFPLLPYVHTLRSHRSLKIIFLIGQDSIE